MLDLRRAAEAQLKAATFVTLTFLTQKSGVRGERVGHGSSGTSLACPVTSVVQRILCLRRPGATATTPLCAFSFSPGGPLIQLKSNDFTDTLRVEAALTSEQHGVDPKRVSAGCFRITGAMALFCAGVDSSRIRLLGRWNSWAMLRYLHLQSDTAMNSLARRMMNGGAFSSLHTNAPPPRDPEAPDAPPLGASRSPAKKVFPSTTNRRHGEREARSLSTCCSACLCHRIGGHHSEQIT